MFLSQTREVSSSYKVMTAPIGPSMTANTKTPTRDNQVSSSPGIKVIADHKPVSTPDTTHTRTKIDRIDIVYLYEKRVGLLAQPIRT